MNESRKNFDLVKKDVKLQKPHQRKKKPSQKSEKQLLNLIWHAIKYRCFDAKNDAFNRYGGRGIGMCSRWKSSFEAFCKDMGPRPSMFHSVERRDNDGDYCPENCYWGTPTEQTRNKRSNLWFTYKGDTMILADFATKYQILYGTLHRRIFGLGWTIEQAIEGELAHQFEIFYEGKLYSRRALCRHLGLNFGRVNWYITTGRSPREAFEICLSKPPMGG